VIRIVPFVLIAVIGLAGCGAGESPEPPAEPAATPVHRIGATPEASVELFIEAQRRGDLDAARAIIYPEDSPFQLERPIVIQTFQILDKRVLSAAEAAEHTQAPPRQEGDVVIEVFEEYDRSVRPKEATVRSVLVACWLILSTHAVGADSPAVAANVILMIADGAGFNTWDATAIYKGDRGAEFHAEPGWVRLAVSTHPLRDTREAPLGPGHGNTQLPSLVYDPARAWDSTPAAGEAGGYRYYFEGYRWLRHASDSANTATTLVSGIKTYVGAINVDGDGEPIEETLAWLADRQGKRVGAVTTVPLNHATPAAAGGAHNESRRNYCEIAWEMLTNPTLDLIVGAGNPDFDNNGEPVGDPERKLYRDVGDKAIWDALSGHAPFREGDPVCLPAGEAGGDSSDPRKATAEEVAQLSRWVLEQEKSEIEAAATGATPQRLLIVPQVGGLGYWSGNSIDPLDRYSVKVGGTLQQQRGSRANPKYTAPGDDPLLAGVPSLETLTRVALNALDGSAGFFLTVEGGAVDWAMHQHQLGRTIEEMLDFIDAVHAVIEWVEAHGGWERTLLVVTADHDHLLAGPGSHEIPFQPLGDNGAGKLPSYRWLSTGHSNHLVPVFARGVGAKRLLTLVDGKDPFRGDYVDQADLFQAMREALTGKPLTE